MKKSYAKIHNGATLLEIMLALSIAGLFLVMGIKMYQSLQNTFQLQALRYNADQLLEAASNYYKANCAAGSISSTPPVFLSPYPSNTGTVSYPPATTSYFPVSISSKLLADGYLANWYPSNPVVDASAGESGYVVQLNPIVSTFSLPVNACVVTVPGQPCLPITNANGSSPTQAYSGTPGGTIPMTQALVVSWVVQVAVKVTPQSKIGAYAALTGADCMSDTSSAGTVDPCVVGNSSHQYLVWVRIPSAALNKQSVFSASMPLLKQFNQLYSQDPNYQFNSGLSATTSPAQAPVYYLCGG